MPYRILNILFFTFWCLVTFAQPKLTLPNYRQYTLRDGLSQMQVTALLQDSRGYIWVGTKAGLNCFNGEKFVSYTTKKFPEITTDHIKQICEDSNGHIWASTHDGIFRMDGSNVKFFKIENNFNLDIDADIEGRIWISNLQNPDLKVSIYCIEHDSLKMIPLGFPENSTMPYVELKYCKEDDALLLAIDNLLYRIKNGTSEVIYRSKNFIHFIPGSDEVFFIEGFRDDIYAEDIYDFDLKNYNDGKIRILARIRNGSIAENTGLNITLPYVCVSLPHSYFIITPNSIDYKSFGNLYTNQVIFDREGKFWLGSEDGFYQLFGDAFTAYKQDVLPQIWGITEDKNGAIWFSSYLYGLYKKENDKLEHFPGSYSNNVYDFYFHPSVDKRGRIFFPNAFGILMADGTRFKQNIERLYLTTFYDSTRDLLWAGRSKGAAAFNANHQKVRIIDDAAGLNVGNYVLTIGRDSAGYYWFGGGSGLARYDWDRNQLKHFRPKVNNFGVYSQCTDYKGRTWFGSKDGLYFYDSKSDSLLKVNREELSDVVNMVATIDSSWLIASQPYGIYLMDLQQYNRNGEVVLHLFNEKNGFTGIEPGQDGAFTDSKGNVWMTTSTELMKLDPGKLKFGKNALSIRIDKYNGQKLPFSAKVIKLPGNQSSAVITFDAICFSRPNPVEYSWKLDRDSAWSSWQVEDYAVLSDLSDGENTFYVKARIKGLPVDVLPLAEIKVVVDIAIYRQPWFFPTLFLIVSLIGILLLFSAVLKTKQAGREAKVFQVQAIQSQMNPHFIFNVLASLQSMILKANVSKANDYLVKLADLVRGFLEASAGTGTLKNPKSTEGHVTIKEELKLLSEFVEFQQVIHPGRFDFELKIDPYFDIEQEMIPPMLIQPFIENAIRHGILPSERKGLLKLIISKTEKAIMIEVSDNGVGIERAGKLIEKSPMRYTSRGKELTLKRIDLLNQLGFRIEIETKSDNYGTIIKLIIFK